MGADAYRGSLGRLLRRYGSMPTYLLLMAMMLILRLSMFLFKLQSGYLTDALLDGAPMTPYLLMVVCTFAVRLAASPVEHISRMRFMEGFRLNMRESAADTIAHAQIPAMEGIHSGDAATRLSGDLDAVVGFFGVELSFRLTDIAYALGAFVYSLTISPWLFAATAVSVPLTVFLSSRAAIPTTAAEKAKREAASAVSATATDVLTGIETVKSIGAEQSMLDRLLERLSAYARASFRATGVAVSVNAVSILLSTAPLAIAIGVGGWLIARGETTPGTMLAYALILNDSSVYVIGRLGMFFANIRQTRVSADRFAQILDLPREPEGGAAQPLPGDAVLLKNVRFHYEGKEPALIDAFMRVGRGERVALVGASGSGKTTVLKLLQGWYRPDEGSVRVMGREVSEWSPDALSQQMAVAGQDMYLFSGTLRENLLDGKPGAHDAQLEAALEAGVLTPVLSDIGGLDAQVGERGENLSGGQRQRASLTRAFLRGAPLLLLDEPTSALDANTENAVQRALDSLDQSVSVLVVAHRLRTVRGADRIYVLENGRIAQEGRHEELIAREGPYRRLFESQAEGGLTA